jgi:hypothetical protein
MRDSRAAFFLALAGKLENVRVFRCCLEFGALNPNNLSQKPGGPNPELRTPNPEPRTMWVIQQPEPEHVPQQDIGQRRFNPNKLTPAGIRA